MLLASQLLGLPEPRILGSPLSSLQPSMEAHAQSPQGAWSGDTALALLVGSPQWGPPGTSHPGSWACAQPRAHPRHRAHPQRRAHPERCAHPGHRAHPQHPHTPTAPWPPQHRAHPQCSRTLTAPCTLAASCACLQYPLHTCNIPCTPATSLACPQHPLQPRAPHWGQRGCATQQQVMLRAATAAAPSLPAPLFPPPTKDK